jgi:hypothetical protein
MYEHSYFIYEGDDKFSFRNGKENKQIKKGKIDKDFKEKEEPVTLESEVERINKLRKDKNELS